MRGEILGVERRRYWGDDEKLAIVSAVGVGGATVTQVAQRHDVTRQQIYAWRHELKRKGLWSPDAGALFLPVDAPSIPDLPAVSNPVPAVWIGRLPTIRPSALRTGPWVRSQPIIAAPVSNRRAGRRS